MSSDNEYRSHRPYRDISKIIFLLLFALSMVVACSAGPNSEEATSLLKEKWNYDATKQSDFRLSILMGQKDAVELFLAAGISPSTSTGEQPMLAYAISGHKYEIAELLISNGADVNAKDNAGRSPIILAVAGCYARPLKGVNQDQKSHLIQLLIDAGADLNAKFPDGPSLFEYSVDCPKIHEMLQRTRSEQNKTNL